SAVVTPSGVAVAFRRSALNKLVVATAASIDGNFWSITAVADGGSDASMVLLDGRLAVAHADSTRSITRISIAQEVWPATALDWQTTDAVAQRPGTLSLAVVR